MSTQYTPLSGSEIFDFLDGKANIITYKELYKYKNINEALGKYNALIILYEAKPNIGHWVVLWKTPHNKTIEFFDPYGMIPDEELKWIPLTFRQQSQQLQKKIVEMLYDSSSEYIIEYNNYRFQNIKDLNIATCGRHCVLRLYFRNLPIDSYYKMIFKACKYYGCNPDELVSALIV